MDFIKISPDSVVKAAPDHASANLEDEVVILHLEDGVYYGLNPVGAMVWNLIQDPRTFREIRDKILAEYDVEAQRCEEDLLKLLQEMAARGLILLENAQNS